MKRNKKQWFFCQSCIKLKHCKAGKLRYINESELVKAQVGCYDREQAEKQLHFQIIL